MGFLSSCRETTDGQILGRDWPPGQTGLDRAEPSAGNLELGDLGELELDRRLAAEDVDEHLELELVLVDLDDLAGELRERAFLDPDGLADLVLEAGTAL